MSGIVFTIVQNDFIGLKLWLDYYKRYFDAIHVIGRGTRDENLPALEAMGKEYNFTHEVHGILGDPREEAKNLSDRAAEYHRSYDWVLYCDMDEFLVADPRLYDALKDLMDCHPGPWVACTAYDVLQLEDEEPIDFEKPYLTQRKYWIRNKDYNKVLLSKIPIYWGAGLHQINEVNEEMSKKIDRTGLFLTHLKNADPHAEGRDLGPTLSNRHYGTVTQNQPNLELIPKEVRRAF